MGASPQSQEEAENIHQIALHHSMTPNLLLTGNSQSCKVLKVLVREGLPAWLLT